MPSRLTKRLGLDTVAKLEAAAVWRLDDGRLLETAGRLCGAIYLFGYVAEARLQAAVLRVLRYRPETEVTVEARSRLIAEATSMRFMGRTPHNVAGWAKYLALKRKQLSHGFKPAVRDEVNYHAEAVYGHWRPTLRYRAITPTADELNAVRNGAVWFNENYKLLWS